MPHAVHVLRRTRRNCCPPRPKISLVMSLHEPLKRGVKTFLREYFDLQGAEFVVLIPDDCPWSDAVARLAIPNFGDLLMVSDWLSNDPYHVFEMLEVKHHRGFALAPAKLIELSGGDELQAHLLIRTNNYVF